MPRKRSVVAASKFRSGGRANFRRRYREAEARRDALMLRLRALGEPACRHPSHARILKLLTTTFRKASLAERAAVLQAANWMIAVLEQLMLFI